MGCNDVDKGPIRKNRMSIFEEFKWRGLLKDATEGLEEQLTREKTIGYIGFDPTADSLHVGSLLPIMCLARLQTFGHGDESRRPRRHKGHTADTTIKRRRRRRTRKGR